MMLNLRMRPTFKPIAISLLFVIIPSIYIFLTDLVYHQVYSSLYFGIINSIGMLFAIGIALRIFKMSHFLKNWFRFNWKHSLSAMSIGIIWGVIRWNVFQSYTSSHAGGDINLLNTFVRTKLYIDIFILIVSPTFFYPLLEEICFRGMIQTYFFRIYKNTFISICLTSLLFAFMHLTSALNWIIFIYIFVIGVVLSLIKNYSSSLWPPILFHSAYNFVELLIKINHM